jgi:hypothetical protein
VTSTKSNLRASMIAALVFSGIGSLLAGTATNVTGLFYTGVGSNGLALGDNTTDSHWSITYARVDGNVYTGNSAYTGAGYVVDSNYVDGAWVQNSSTSRWITAPGADTSNAGNGANNGGDYLPGNGTSGDNSAYFVYRLAFTITGSTSGGTDVSNNVSITLTLAADDQYSIYVNPNSSPTVGSSGTIHAGGTAASASGTSAWNNTTAVALQNYGSNNDADFVIGTNYLYVVVANTNSATGTSNSTSLNPSGLLVYQVGAATLIDGTPVPEVGTILPVLGAFALYGWRRWRGRTLLLA